MSSALLTLLVLNLVLVPASYIIKNENHRLIITREAIPFVSKDYLTSYNIKDLRFLEMVNCQIQSLDKAAFDSITNVTRLSLSGNKFTHLPPVFENTVNLQSLSISHNALRKLDHGIFANLFSLQELYLNYNKIETIDKHVFDNLSALSTLSMYNNKITYLASDIFHYTTQLKELYLEDNNIANIKKGTFSNLLHLQTLALTGNKLVSIKKHSFEKLYSLTNLRLDYNQISKLDNDVFKDNSALVFLTLRDNRLKELQDNIFSNLFNLEILFLSYNSIAQFNTNAFPSNNSISTLLLDNNKLQFINLSMFPHLEMLKLSNNPWFCDCEVKQLIDIVARYPIPSWPVCFQPKPLEGTLWSKLHKEDLVCTNETNALRKILQDKLLSSNHSEIDVTSQDPTTQPPMSHVVYKVYPPDSEFDLTSRDKSTEPPMSHVVYKVDPPDSGFDLTSRDTTTEPPTSNSVIDSLNEKPTGTNLLRFKTPKYQLEFYFASLPDVQWVIKLLNSTFD